MLQAISPCTQANSEWMFAWNNSHKLSGGKIYHATSPKSEFRAGSSCCIENRNCCCFIRYSLLLCVLFFPPFSMAVTDAENRKKIGRGPGSYPVHMLYFAMCSPRSIVKSKTHNIECFRTFSPIGDIPVGWEETIPSSWCEIIFVKCKKTKSNYTLTLEIY